MKETIYCISGLGADEKIFSNLHFKGYTLKHLPWLRPHKNEKIESYAGRMASSIEHSSPILLGVSFGGMIGIEIARQMELKKLILVSSIKSSAELPRWMKLAGRLKLNKILPNRSLTFTERIDNRRLGVSNEDEKQMARAYRKSADSVYIDWAIHQIINWNNDWQPPHIAHLHGDSDKIFPVKKITGARIIKGGTHMMIYNRSKEISQYISEELEK
jgi:pimeloyl-ACP methyl ester carboxylesterase